MIMMMWKEIHWKIDRHLTIDFRRCTWALWWLSSTLLLPVVIITKTDDHVMHNECPTLLNNNSQHITSHHITAHLQKHRLHPTPTHTRAHVTHAIVVQITREIKLTIKLVVGDHRIHHLNDNVNEHYWEIPEYLEWALCRHVSAHNYLNTIWFHF